MKNLCGKLLFSSLQNNSIYTAFKYDVKDKINGIFIIKTKKLERFLLKEGFLEIKKELEKYDSLKEKFFTIKSRLDKNEKFKNLEEYKFFEGIYLKISLLKDNIDEFIKKEGTWILKDGSVPLNWNNGFFKNEVVKSIIFELSYENMLAFKQLFDSSLFIGIETLEDFNEFLKECEKEFELTLFYLKVLDFIQYIDF